MAFSSEWYGSHIAELEKERDQLRAQLGDLLATIHRDGGQHTESVGWDESVREAARLVQSAKDTEARCARMREALGKIKTSDPGAIIWEIANEALEDSEGRKG